MPYTSRKVLRKQVLRRREVRHITLQNEELAVLHAPKISLDFISYANKKQVHRGTHLSCGLAGNRASLEHKLIRTKIR